MASSLDIPTAPSVYPTPSTTALQLQFIGKHINNVPTPAAVIDAAVVRRNCKLMLEATEALDVAFRAHVKTHKVRQHLHDTFEILSANEYSFRQRRLRECKLERDIILSE